MAAAFVDLNVTCISRPVGASCRSGRGSRFTSLPQPKLLDKVGLRVSFRLPADLSGPPLHGCQVLFVNVVGRPKGAPSVGALLFRWPVAGDLRQRTSDARAASVPWRLPNKDEARMCVAPPIRRTDEELQ